MAQRRKNRIRVKRFSDTGYPQRQTMNRQVRIGNGTHAARLPENALHKSSLFETLPAPRAVATVVTRTDTGVAKTR
jgi:hypothetical protein